MTSHLENIDVALKFVHVEGFKGGVEEILTKINDPASKIKQHDSHVGFKERPTDKLAG